MVHQDAAHQPRGKAVEVFAVFKAQAALANELEEQLVDHAGGLQQMLRPLTPEQDSRNLPQLRIDQLEEVIDSHGISRSPIAEKDRDFTSLGNSLSPFTQSIVNPRRLTPPVRNTDSPIRRIGDKFKFIPDQ